MITYQGKTLLQLQVNGETRDILARPADLLLDILRDQLGLTGAKPGCKNGDCGTCTVLVDGWPVKSCLMLAVEAVGHQILTVEGLGGDTAVQRAFVKADAFQCGYCTSGFLMVCHSLALNKPDADECETETWLESNICRCTSYREIREGVKLALEEARQRSER